MHSFIHSFGSSFSHAPTCLRVELWNNATGELLCRQEPVYGGSGGVPVSRFDETGYIFQPPCLWGSAEHGLEAPPLASGMPITVVAVTNSTYGHHGGKFAEETRKEKGGGGGGQGIGNVVLSSLTPSSCIWNTSLFLSY